MELAERESLKFPFALPPSFFFFFKSFKKIVLECVLKEML